MPLSPNEIRRRAQEFSNEFRDETRETGEAQTFWNAFFAIFGKSRRQIAIFEQRVTLLGGRTGEIDLFWPGTLIVEHKSAGRNLDSAYSQALEYTEGLEENQLPKYIIVSDFKRIRLEDLDEGTHHEFELEKLVEKIHLFDFVLGRTRRRYVDEDPVNIKAAELMGKLHDYLKDDGYAGHNLEILLVRLMFCLFADDTGIFEKDHFTFYLEDKTNVDGTDVGSQLTSIFQTLKKPEESRQHNIDDDLNKFPHVNGTLFEEQLEVPSFDGPSRKLLLDCCYFDWRAISPAIFGSMFQSVMDPEMRRDFGAHYTSEKNIMKTIKALFLDELLNEYNSHKRNKRYLKEMLKKIAKMKFLDPACGCGNFLIIAYRELRRLEIEIYKQILTPGQQVMIQSFNRGINVDSMYGLETLEFPVRIAEVALWLVDHQINNELSIAFGCDYRRLPLIKSPTILQRNALRINWEDIVPKDELTYILGNPPFVGKKRRTDEQNEDMDLIWAGVRNHGILDYVTCWYAKTAEYISETEIKVAFVSTNSITQGEQVGVLWDHLLNEKGIKIHFAHRTFRWFNKARGKAHVFVVIIGFASFDTENKSIFDYDTPDSDPLEIKVKNINPYLVNQKDIIIKNRSRPLCDVPKIAFGSMPNDGGNLLFKNSEKVAFLSEEPDAKKFIRPFISAREFLNGNKRWCLWLKDANPTELNRLPKVIDRIKKVKEHRLKSDRAATVLLADTPSLFGYDSQITEGSSYVLIPRHSSEHRQYIPIDFLSKDNIAGDSCCVIKNASKYNFGVLTSTMHMAWVRQICGRIKGDYRYSNKLVYNNYPWPENPPERKIKDVEKWVKEVLKVRKEFGDSSLSDLYNPLTMPQKLLNAHKKLDRAVELCYRSRVFRSDLERLNFLFELYNQY